VGPGRLFLLDENILESQRTKLVRWHFHIKQIGHNIGIKGMDDRDDILPLASRFIQADIFYS
jgi:hypothetical protein